jgi:hypothetical protein
MTSIPGTGRLIPLRIAGAVVGSSLPALAGSIVYWLGIDGISLYFSLGVPVGAVIGFVKAPDALTTSNPGRLALKLSAWAALLGLAMLIAWVGLVANGGARGFDLSAIPVVLVTLFFAIFFALWIGVPISLPISIASLVLGRALYRRGLLTIGVAILVVVSSISGGLAFVDAKRQEARQLAGVPTINEDSPVALALARVRLEWTVINRSHQDLYLDVESPTKHGLSGWGAGLHACRISAGRNAVGKGWAVRLAADSPVTWSDPQDREPITSASDHPGSPVQLRLEVDGSALIHVLQDGPMPTESQMEGTLC